VKLVERLQSDMRLPPDEKREAAIRRSRRYWWVFAAFPFVFLALVMAYASTRDAGQIPIVFAPSMVGLWVAFNAGRAYELGHPMFSQR
jgi:lipopolysaccharide export LptBFGC system permease protein LptF